jgi:CheY-like chemotaxis protein
MTPEKQRLRARAMENLGIRFTFSTSTEGALEKLRRNRYDVVISDMGRPPDNRAGYTLLAEMQKQGDMTPFIVYAGSNLPEHRAEARKRGAYGNTNNPQELFELVLRAIQAGAKA